MRFVLSLLIWFIMVGGVYSYTQIRDQARVSSVTQQLQITSAAGEYTVTITPTFSVESDPFALTTDTDVPAGFELWLNGQRLAVEQSSLRQGNELIIAKVQGFIDGGNEIFVKASPPVSGDVDNYALRVQLLENGSVIKEKTIWSSGGAQVSGTMTVILGQEEKEEHDH